MSEEIITEEHEKIIIPPKEPNYCYVAEEVTIAKEAVEDIKSIIADKFAMLEYFHDIKVAFLWTTDKLTDEELGKLNRLYGFYEVR